MALKIDLTYLENMSAGDNSLIVEMIDIFKEQLPEFVLEMENAVKNNDSKALSSVAHKAKSSVAIMGISELTNELNILETIAGNNERNDEYSDFVNKFKITTEEAIKLFDDIVKGFNL